MSETVHSVPKRVASTPGDSSGTEVALSPELSVPGADT